jgi:hypothetical protein
MSEAQIKLLFVEIKRLVEQQQEQLKVIHNFGKAVESYSRQTAHLTSEVTGAIEHMREMTQRLSLVQQQLDRHSSDLYPAVSEEKKA